MIKNNIFKFSVNNSFRKENIDDSNALLLKDNDNKPSRSIKEISINNSLRKEKSKNKHKIKKLLSTIKYVRDRLKKKLKTSKKMNETTKSKNNISICSNEHFFISSVYPNQLSSKIILNLIKINDQPSINTSRHESIDKKSKSHINYMNNNDKQFDDIKTSSGIINSTSKLRKSELISNKKILQNEPLSPPKQVRRLNIHNSTYSDNNLNMNFARKNQGIPSISPIKNRQIINFGSNKRSYVVASNKSISNFNETNSVPIKDSVLKTFQKNKINLQIQEKEQKYNPKMFLENFLNHHLNKKG